MKTSSELETKRQAKVEKACELLHQSFAARGEAEKLLRQCGVILCSGINDAYEPDAKIGVHVFEGVKKLGRLMGKPLSQVHDIFGEESEGQKAVIADGLCFFQLGRATEKNFKYN